MQIFTGSPAWRKHWLRWPRMRLGLDIGDTAIRAVVLCHRRGFASVIRWACAPLPAGAMHHGKVIDPDAVAHALRQCLGRGRWPRAVMALPVCQIRHATVTAPVNMSEQVWPDWIESEAKRLLPAIDDSGEAVHYDACAASAASHASPSGAFRVIAAASSVIDDRVAVAERAGLRTVAIDAEHYALQRAFVWGAAAVPRRTDGVTALAWLADGRATLSLYDGAHVLREVAVGRDGIGADPGPAWADAIRSALAQARMQINDDGVLSDLPDVSQIWLGGSHASGSEICDAVCAACELPVALIDPFEGYAVCRGATPLPPESDRAAYLLACGLAMHGEAA